MTRLCLRWMIGCSVLSLLLSGCASDRTDLSPSLMGKLQGKKDGVQRVSYQTDSQDNPASKKIKDPLNLKLHYARWVEEMKDYPEARRNYIEVLEQYPENFDAILGMARIDHASGDMASAETGFQRALALRPNAAAAQHAYGQFQLSQGRITEALPLLNQALLSQPDNKAYHYHLAVALAAAGDVNAALPHFKQTVGDAAAHHNIATVLRDRGDIRGAEQHFRQALTIDPKLEQARHALAALHRHQQSQQFAGNPRGGSVIQGTPNASTAQRVVPTAHQTTSPGNSLSPAQREQLRNQR